jgi:hypothetical protein
LTSPENAEGRLSAASGEDDNKTDHPDSTGQHQSSYRGRNGQHRSVDRGNRSIGEEKDSTRRAGRFEWEKALREEFVSPRSRFGEVKATLFVLATYADGDGSGAFPSQKTIGKVLGKSERGVRDHLRLAAEAGWIIRSRRGKNRTTRYSLSLPDRPPMAGRNGTETESNPDEADGHDRPPMAGRNGTETESNPDEADGHDRPPMAGVTGHPWPVTSTETSPEEEQTLPAFALLDLVSTDSATTTNDRGPLANARARCDQEGDGVNVESFNLVDPAELDVKLHAKLCVLPPEVRASAVEAWLEPGGPEVVRACVERASDYGTLDEDRFVELLDAPAVFYACGGDGEGASRGDYRQSWRDAVALAKTLDAEGYGYYVTISAVVGKEAQREIERQSV